MSGAVAALVEHALSEATPARARIFRAADTLGKHASGEVVDIVEARVQFVMALITDGIFAEGETFADIAEAWNLNESTARRLTAEASRRAKALVNGAAVQLKLALAMDRRLGDAESIGDPKDRVDATVAVVKAYAPLVGAAPPARLDATVTYDMPPPIRALYDAAQRSDPGSAEAAEAWSAWYATQELDPLQQALRLAALLESTTRRTAEAERPQIAEALRGTIDLVLPPVAVEGEEER